LQQSEVLITEP